MKEIQTLNKNYKRWIIQELYYYYLCDIDTIAFVMFKGEWKFCEDEEELKEDIKKIWNIEFADDNKFKEYLNDNSDIIIVICDDVDVSFLINPET